MSKFVKLQSIFKDSKDTNRRCSDEHKGIIPWTKSLYIFFDWFCIDDLDTILLNLNKALLSSERIIITRNYSIINIPALPIENVKYNNIQLPEQNVFNNICSFDKQIFEVP